MTKRVRYYYPQDISFSIVGGKRVASVNFNLPQTWTEEATQRAKDDFIDGWCIARRAYEKVQEEKIFATTYPYIYEERVEQQKQYAEWKVWMLNLISSGIFVNTPEFRLAKSNYKGKLF